MGKAADARAARIQAIALSIHPSPRLKDRESPSFERWLDRFLKSAEGRNAAQRLSSIEPNGGQQFFPHLVFLLLCSCYAAAHYQDDAGIEYRRRMAELREAKSHAGRMAKELGTLFKRYPELHWAWPAEMSLRQRPLDAGKKQPVAENMSRLLLELSRNLKAKLPETDGGPFLNRFTFGCLRFEKPLTGSKSPGVLTALLFDLVFLFRKWTGTGALHSQNAEPMPQYGESHLVCATALACAALGETIGDATARRRLNSIMSAHGGASHMGWPNLE